MTSKASKRNKRIVVGGDFNTQYGIGNRGLLFDEFAKDIGLPRSRSALTPSSLIQLLTIARELCVQLIWLRKYKRVEYQLQISLEIN